VSVKLKPEVKEKWVTALRSGNYQQGTGLLHYVNADKKDCFCVWGVLCELAVEEGVVKTYGSITGDYLYGPDDPRVNGSPAVPPPEVIEWAFGPEVTSDIKVTLEYDNDSEGGTRETLIYWNDDCDMPFDTFATLIEEQL
jgi:hypothetical protein